LRNNLIFELANSLSVGLPRTNSKHSSIERGELYREAHPHQQHLDPVDFAFRAHPCNRKLCAGSAPHPGQGCCQGHPEYQTSSCAQLKEQKAEKTPPTPQEQKAIQFLKSDPQMRTLFINKIAAPIANKMFDCGMIP
jgi:hypothetical protein